MKGCKGYPGTAGVHSGCMKRHPLLVAGLLLHASLAFGGEFSDDLSARRSRMMERLGPDAMAVLFSAPTRNYSLDVDYEYRQDSNFYYLTGLLQQDSILVLMPGNASRREILFVSDRNPEREHWNGRLLSRAEATELTGVRTVLGRNQFEPFVGAMLSRRGSGEINDQEAAAFFEALGAGRARVGLVLQAGGIADPLSPPQDFARRIRERYAGFQAIDITSTLTDLRLIKTPYERKVLVRSLDIANEAQMAGMRAARPGGWEYEVEAAIEAVHRSRGAVSWSYPSIVASGPNATILHYNDNNRQMQAGELLLVDAAANYGYMSGDITRTYPIGGAFTQSQKDIYAIVLQAQEEAIKVARAGTPLSQVHDKTVEVIKAGLLKLGLITDASGDQYRMWYTHGANHYIGIDVHDVGERTRPLQPGMAFVIEPGLYIRQSAIENLQMTAANRELVDRIQPAVKKYAEIGVRIEDAFLLEEDGLRRLTASVPRTIDEIEAFMRKRTPAPTSAAR
jgi:Xaa-Pro aminopeptidase